MDLWHVKSKYQLHLPHEGQQILFQFPWLNSEQAEKSLVATYGRIWLYIIIHTASITLGSCLVSTGSTAGSATDVIETVLQSLERKISI